MSKKRRRDNGTTGRTKTTPDGEHYIQIQADGDCGFACFCTAGATELDVRGLRARVAESLTEDHFSALQAAFAADPRGYSYMRRCRSLHDLRTLTRPTGSEVGSRMCVWADWTHLQLMANITKVTCLMRDQTSGLCLVIKPEDAAPAESESESESRSSSSCAASLSSSYLHILRVNNVHFNLFAISDKRIFTREELEDTSLASRFDL